QFPVPSPLFLRLGRRRCFPFFTFATFVIGQTEERSDRLPDTRSLVLLLELRLASDREPRKRDRFQTRVGDRFTRHLANSVSADLDSFQRLIDLVKRVLLLRKQAEREIAIVGIGAGVSLVHSKRRSFAAFSARTERVLRHAGHGIDHGIAQLQELLLLLARERAQFTFAMIASEQRLSRARAGANARRLGFLYRNLATWLWFAGFLS